MRPKSPNKLNKHGIYRTENITSCTFSLRSKSLVDILLILGNLMLNSHIFKLSLCKRQEEVMTMSVSYNKLWKLLIDKGMKKKDLRDGVEMSSNTLAKLGRNEYVALDVLVRTCDYLHCDIGDIMEVIPDEKENQG